MNFRAAKSEPKMRHLRSDGWKFASTPVGRRAGRGAEEAFGVCRSLSLIRHASCTRGTGPADPNAPSGASTAGPVLVDRHLGAVDCVLQGAAGGSTL